MPLCIREAADLSFTFIVPPLASVTSIGNPHTQVHTHTRTTGKEAGRFQPRRRELPLGLRQCDVTQDVFGERTANGYEDVYESGRACCVCCSFPPESLAYVKIRPCKNSYCDIVVL